jgi:AmmeMemoRadiSam system protein A
LKATFRHGHFRKTSYAGGNVNSAGENSSSGASKALTGPEREFLLQLARESLEGFFKRTSPSISVAGYPTLGTKRGCFVTLLRRGALRGCVGNVVPRLPLSLAVIENARSAAFNDSRFPPLEFCELSEIAIEISILTNPMTLSGNSAGELLGQIRPRLDGVLLEFAGRVSTYLPQVWEKLPGPVDFMNSLAQKAGLPADSWQDPAAVISVYQAESFSE